jgi:molybdopterin molybdotransferase
MPEFLRLTPRNEAQRILLDGSPGQKTEFETLTTEQALGRVLAEDVPAPHPMPEFPRSAMDGYAVRARDTFGASESQPGYLSLAGEVLMGSAPMMEVTAGTCMLIHTGGMLPAGADAVIMLEYTQAVSVAGKNTPAARGTEIEISRAVAAGENVIRAGEDVERGEVILEAGHVIGPAEIGGCMGLGITTLRVVIKPKVGILSSGDEVIAPQEPSQPGKVRDVNSYSLASIINRAGGIPVLYGIIPDDLQALQAKAACALQENDIIVITAGSSASVRDRTAEAIAQLGSPGILVHGVNIRPGKPTILAVCDGKTVIGLPGNPVSALVIAQLFLVPVIEKLLGRKPAPAASIRANLAANIPSLAGREDWVPVRLKLNNMLALAETLPSAEPIFSKSNLIFSIARADGLVRIPPDSTGLGAGEVVEVFLL